MDNGDGPDVEDFAPFSSGIVPGARRESGEQWPIWRARLGTLEVLILVLAAIFLAEHAWGQNSCQYWTSKAWDRSNSVGDSL